MGTALAFVAGSFEGLHEQCTFETGVREDSPRPGPRVSEAFQNRAP